MIRTRCRAQTKRLSLHAGEGGAELRSARVRPYNEETSSLRWGCTNPRHPRRTCLRSLPTPVGLHPNVRSWPCSRSTPSHLGGTGPTRLALAALACETSPSRWGCPRETHDDRAPSLPTSVGLHPNAWSSPHWHSTLPHCGGAVPERRVLGVLIYALSPQAWGCSRERQKRHADFFPITMGHPLTRSAPHRPADPLAAPATLRWRPSWTPLPRSPDDQLAGRRHAPSRRCRVATEPTFVCHRTLNERATPCHQHHSRVPAVHASPSPPIYAPTPTPLGLASPGWRVAPSSAS